MSAHVPEPLLAGFVDGTLPEAVAVAVATHLDGCPRCAARAAGLEPLQGDFAKLVDPPVPPGLVAEVLARVEAAPRAPGLGPDAGLTQTAAAEPDPDSVPLELVVGGGLLTAAAALLAGLGEPLALVAQAGLWASAAGSVGRALLVGLSPALVLPLTLLVGASGTAVLVRATWPDAVRDAA